MDFGTETATVEGTTLKIMVKYVEGLNLRDKLLLFQPEKFEKRRVCCKQICLQRTRLCAY